jgi:hypothetical protein
MNPSLDWTPYVPDYDNQFSAGTHVDAEDCVSQSAVHSIETQILFLTGQRVRFSPRALGKLSGTTPQGNSTTNVLAAIKKYGLIPYESWPDLDNFTWDEYYKDIPQDVIDQGKDFLLKWNVEFFSGVSDDALQFGPIWLELKEPTTNHFVEQINSHQFFDSYQPAIKETTLPVVNRFQILISPKGANMELVKDNGTVFLVSTDKTSKIGIGNQDVLTAFFPTEPITDGDTSHIPQVGTLADGVILHK